MTKKHLSAQKAIDAKCKDCIYDELDIGTWRDQTTLCPAKSCDLWEYRPLNKASKLAIKEEKVANMSPEQLEKYKKKQEKAKETLQSARKS